jgi:hypothetical protein
MNKMARSRRNCGCESKESECGSRRSEFNRDNNFVDPINISRRQNERRRFPFPTDIKRLLILIAEDEGNNRVDIVLDACANHCFIEDAKAIAVTDNTLIIRDGDKFRFVDICCICEVIVDCDAILDELFEQHSLNRE